MVSSKSQFQPLNIRTKEGSWEYFGGLIFIPTVSLAEKGVADLFSTVRHVYNDAAMINKPYGNKFSPLFSILILTGLCFGGRMDFPSYDQLAKGPLKVILYRLAQGDGTGVGCMNNMYLYLNACTSLSSLLLASVAFHIRCLPRTYLTLWHIYVWYDTSWGFHLPISCPAFFSLNCNRRVPVLMKETSSSLHCMRVATWYSILLKTEMFIYFLGGHT